MVTFFARLMVRDSVWAEGESVIREEVIEDDGVSRSPKVTNPVYLEHAEVKGQGQRILTHIQFCYYHAVEYELL